MNFKIYRKDQDDYADLTKMEIQDQICFHLRGFAECKRIIKFVNEEGVPITEVGQQIAKLYENLAFNVEHEQITQEEVDYLRDYIGSYMDIIYAEKTAQELLALLREDEMFLASKDSITYFYDVKYGSEKVAQLEFITKNDEEYTLTFYRHDIELIAEIGANTYERSIYGTPQELINNIKQKEFIRRRGW